ncbi:Mur ligase family protein [Corynebacterium coyleae]|uniref:Mur ligase family protein n=1 Tax=Corynebacterium coyleae TaxID=53374 RepID=UPI00254BE080|nr:Mur ligase family protein [Corynebacterium coyleae]MDK8663851.1 Mur ligase family protein [Corynebacterium coyleae]MDK8706806.1 Mur ligase family protein [Corynebacterium coyleae]MDK8733653.1 Mur ligase family protein [Corynebacterium coyleae]MDK8892849.1 Mur ligase family protein [Corynebacterium coyleae]
MQGPISRARARLATTAAHLATAASRATGRGAGGMIGGLVAGAIDPNIMATLGGGRPTVLVTGTNGKSTTTRMLAGAVRTKHTVATNDGGDNMDAGIISALLAGKDAEAIVLECDELHVPKVAERLQPKAFVLLNLTRDQLDRVGEINSIERALRGAVMAHPDAVVVANCDDVLISSIAYDHPNVIWVAAGAGWLGDSVTNPRSGGHIVRSSVTHDEETDWYAVEPLPDGREFRRPTPQYTVTDNALQTPQGAAVLDLKLPGRANRGNAAQAIACAVEAFGVPLDDAVRAASEVDNVAGRYTTVHLGDHDIHLLLAKNPAGWQEALSMIDRDADGVVIAVNAKQGDGEDVSWLWDVKFEDFGDTHVVASGERATDLAVRLTYGGIDHERITDPVEAIRACPPGRVEVLANYTALLNLRRALSKQEDYRA